MIGVQIDNEFIDLPVNASITMRLPNPIFNTGNIIPGEYSFPFNVPCGQHSPKNSRLFKIPQVVENIESLKRIPSKLFYRGVPFKNGKITLTSISNKNSLAINYIFGLSNVSEELRTKKLRDVFSETSVLYSEELTKRIYCKPTASFSKYKLVVNGSHFEDDTMDGLRFKINQRSEELRVLALYITFGTTPLGMEQPFLQLSPYNPSNPSEDLSHFPESVLSVAPIEDTAEEKEKWYIEAYDQTAYNNKIKDYMSEFLVPEPYNNAIRFPFLWNDKIWGDQQFIKSNNCVNGQSSGEIMTNDANWGVTNTKPFEVLNNTVIHPFMRVKYALDKIAEVLGFKWEGDWYNDPITDKMLIWNTSPASFPLEYVGVQKYLFHKSSFKYSDLVPDITVVDFLKGLQNRYNLAIYMNQLNGKVRIQKRNTIWKNLAYDDVTSLSSPIEKINFKQLNGVMLVSKKEENDIYGWDDQKLIGEEGELVIDAKCGAIKANRTGFPFIPTEELTGPVLGQATGTKFNLRIFYDRGMVSNGVVDYYGALNNPGDYHDTFDGDDGLYSMFYKPYIRSLINMKEVEIDVNYPLRRLRNFDYEIRTRYDRIDYFIKEINVTLSNNAVSVSKVILAKI
jgi:hypothetical protein